MTHVAWVEHVLSGSAPELPSGLVEEWSSLGGEATLAESDQRIAKQAVAWAWERRALEALPE
jgi:actin-like ATPase involved in cell morphogenesis